MGKGAIAVYCLKLARGRSLFIVPSWQEGDLSLLSQIGKEAIAVYFCKWEKGRSRSYWATEEISDIYQGNCRN